VKKPVIDRAVLHRARVAGQGKQAFLCPVLHLPCHPIHFVQLCSDGWIYSNKSYVNYQDVVVKYIIRFFNNGKA